MYPTGWKLIPAQNSPQGKRQFSISRRGEYVGAGELMYLPQGGICYLRWIYTEEMGRTRSYLIPDKKEI